MAKYRDDLQGAQLRLRTLEAKIKEKEAELSERDAALGARDAEIDELRSELDRAKRDLPPGAAAAGGERSKRGLLLGVVAAVGCAVAAMGVVLVGTSKSSRSAPAPAASATAVPISPKPRATTIPANTTDSSSHFGLLLVRFKGPAGARVYASGKDVGPVNSKISLPCHKPAVIRIGKTPGPTWLSAARTVQLACKAQTVLDLSPKMKP